MVATQISKCQHCFQLLIRPNRLTDTVSFAQQGAEKLPKLQFIKWPLGVGSKSHSLLTLSWNSQTPISIAILAHTLYTAGGYTLLQLCFPKLHWADFMQHCCLWGSNPLSWILYTGSTLNQHWERLLRSLLVLYVGCFCAYSSKMHG